MSAKRGPGRPLTPGNEPGNNGNPTLRIRMAPADLERVHRAGGSAWARGVLLAALTSVEGLEAAERWAFGAYLTADAGNGPAFEAAKRVWLDAKARLEGALEAREGARGEEEQ